MVLWALPAEYFKNEKYYHAIMIYSAHNIPEIVPNTLLLERKNIQVVHISIKI